MKYCKECGHQMNENAQFCNNCGATSTQTNQVNQNSPTPASAQTNVKTTSTKEQVNNLVTKLKNLSKKQKIISSVVVAFVLILFIGYQIGLAQTSKEKALEDLQTAIIDNDTKTLSKLIVSDDSRVKITEDTLESFVTYVNENPIYLDVLMNDLEGQAEALDNSENEDGIPASAFGSNQILTLSNAGKTALIFDKYRFNIQSFYIGAYTNYEGATIYLNGEEIGTADSSDYYKQFGPFVPGTHQLKAVYEGEFATLETEQEINSFDYNGSAEVSLDLYGLYIDVDANYYDAEILVNGESVNVAVEDFYSFGPVSPGTKLQAVKEFPWGEAKSEEVTVGEDTSYYSLYIDPLAGTTADSIVDTITTFQQNQSTAFVQLDESLVSQVTDDYLAETKESIANWKESDRKWHGDGLQSINIDLASFEVNYDENQYYGSARYTANFLGEWGYGDDSQEDIDESKQEEETTYIYVDFVYDEANKQWLISDYEESYWSFSIEHGQEVTY